MSIAMLCRQVLAALRLEAAPYLRECDSHHHENQSEDREDAHLVAEAVEWKRRFVQGSKGCEDAVSDRWLKYSIAVCLLDEC